MDQAYKRLNIVSGQFAAGTASQVCLDSRILT